MINRTRSPSWFGAMLAGLVVALAATWWWAASDEAERSAAAASSPAAPAPLLAQTPAPATAPTSVAPAAKPADAARPASAFKLLGTVVAANGADSFALVRRTADSQLLRLRTGDLVGGLTVRAIESDDVVLAGVGQPVVVEADRTAASLLPSQAVSPPPFAPDVEPAWAGDPAPFGH